MFQKTFFPTRFLRFLRLFCLTLLLCGCAGQKPEREIMPVTAQNFQLDTLITITLYDGVQSQIREAFDEIGRLEKLLSIAAPGSDPDRLAQNAGGDYIEVSEDTIFLITESEKYSVMSEGAFDCTVGPLASLWGISDSGGHYPSAEELDRALALVNYRDALVKENKSVLLQKSGMRADFGAIAKGYIADRVKVLLTAKGITSAVLDLGGNIVLIGSKPDGSVFRIGVRDPAKGAAEYFAVFEVSDISLVSSGPYERRFVHEGREYHHLLDVKTGFPADNELLQVTILSAASCAGDGFSTTAYLLGLEKGLALINASEGVEGVFVTRDKKVYLTNGIGSEFRLVSDDYEVEYAHDR